MVVNGHRLFLHLHQVGVFFFAAAVVTLAGCVTYVDRPPPASVYVEPYPVFAVQDDYVYYPDYEVYYSNRRRQYAYPEGGRWVSQPVPYGVSVNVLRASPSVTMSFHDSPVNHHAAVVQQYPKNWRPPGANHNQNDHRNDDYQGLNSGGNGR